MMRKYTQLLFVAGIALCAGASDDRGARRAKHASTGRRRPTRTPEELPETIDLEWENNNTHFKRIGKLGGIKSVAIVEYSNKKIETNTTVLIKGTKEKVTVKKLYDKMEKNAEVWVKKSRQKYSKFENERISYSGTIIRMAGNKLRAIVQYDNTSSELTVGGRAACSYRGKNFGEVTVREIDNDNGNIVVENSKGQRLTVKKEDLTLLSGPEKSDNWHVSALQRIVIAEIEHSDKRKAKIQISRLEPCNMLTKKYAVKMVDKQQGTLGTYESEKAGADLQKTLGKSLFINTIVKTYDDENCYYIVMELGDIKGDFGKQSLTEGTEIHKFMRPGVINEEAVKFYASCLVRAIETMHANNIAHRDLKPNNIIINPRNGYLQLCDFGNAKKIEGVIEYDGPTVHPLYASPEVVTKQPYGKEVDWWAFGAMLYEMLIGRQPFGEPSDNEAIVIEKIQNDDPLPEEYITASKISEEAKDLLRQLLEKDITKRLTDGVLTHKWFGSIDFRALNAGKLEAPYIPTKHNKSQIPNETGGQTRPVDDQKES